MHQYEILEGEAIYIAGPECFYVNGYDSLGAMRKESEYYGCKVTLPNDNPLNLDHEDLRKNADEIFVNCANSMNQSTAIIADLETFRGCEPDGGSIYEIGMAYARGIRCYGYTRDLRNMVHKYPLAVLKDGVVYDHDGRELPYQNLPFSPCVMGSCKVIEGNYSDCLQQMIADIHEEQKDAVIRSRKKEACVPGSTLEKQDRPVVYLAGPERYDRDAAAVYEKRKALCESYGLMAVTPMDDAPGVERISSENPYLQAYNDFDRWQQHVRNCDIILGNLNDFHGWEPNSDVSFECGMAWQLGKKCFGYMDSTAIMRKRIPHYGEDKNNKDIYGNDVENFNYPINLMFSSSMPILEGSFEQALEQMAEQLKKEGIL
jgi:nucleoside 2-deoxyribosyltransferase